MQIFNFEKIEKAINGRGLSLDEISEKTNIDVDTLLYLLCPHDQTQYEHELNLLNKISTKMRIPLFELLDDELYENLETKFEWGYPYLSIKFDYLWYLKNYDFYHRNDNKNSDE